MLMDLHVHSNISPCSILSLEDILDEARDRGLDGVCLTDHDTTAVRRMIEDGPRPDGLVVLVGMEYTAFEADVLLFGPEAGEVPPGLGANAVLDMAESAGWAAVVAHPFREGWGPVEGVLRRSPGPCLETINGRNAPEENRQAEAAAIRFGLAAAGGSDAHVPGDVGRAATRFAGRIRSMAELVRALRSREFAPELTAYGAANPLW
jgi:hypothetical protein